MATQAELAAAAALPADAVRMPLGLAPPAIDWRVDPSREAALLDRVRVRWEALGGERPHWSSSARPEFMPEQIGEHRALFAASGEGDADLLLAVLARHGLGPAGLPRLCEFGCGAGRMTAALAHRFATTAAVDVSASHLGVARAAVGAGVAFALANPPEFGMVTPFDLWFSLHTLQHNPPPMAAAILRRAFAVLAPGGVAVFQVATALAGYAFDPAAWLSAPGADALELHVLPQEAVFALASQAGLVPLEVREDCALWPPSLVISNRFVLRKAAR